ncbi:MAG: alpha/beta hydrolase [Burkholderiales bacterium]|nr:alpha/beta hydrolase [Burkholderiales bacterium]
MSGAETVVLVHGLWTNRHVMAWLGARLERAGFAAKGITYPSMREDLDRNAARLGAFIAGLAPATVHIVAHSLGGLVALASLARERPEHVRRVVLLGCPVSGCEVARRVAARAAFRPLLGATLPLWAAPPALAVDERYEVGTIAGTVPVGLGRLFARPAGPSDGVVSAAEARYPRERDHVALAVAHSGLLLSPAVARQTIAFLRTGRFER